MTDNEEEKARANPGYAVGQLAKALLSKGEGAAKRVEQWQAVLAGIADGILQVGSRNPVTGTPSWVTLEVAQGGFATGKFTAGGALKQFETEKALALQKSGLAPEIAGSQKITEGQARTALNVYFAGHDGRPELSEMRKSGSYRIQVPEESALLILGWLIENGEHERASKLLEEIGPFFARLRFYPEPQKTPLRIACGDTVFLQPAGHVVRKLRDKKQQQSVLVMNEAINVWTPLYDRALSLFLETVEGAVPELKQENGELVRAENGQPIAIGGWPCKHYPADWTARANSLLKDYDNARKRQGLGKKHEKAKSNFARLRKYLTIACENTAALTARDVGSIRKILASHVTAHGAPGSERLQSTRSMQSQIASQPLHTDLARVLAERLQNQAEDEGVPEIQQFLQPISAEESQRTGVPSGTTLPGSIIRKALVCSEAPLHSLIEQRLILSSETMALILPMLTARIRATGVRDSDLARVFEYTYRAFRKRRSLLLLNLESQVRFDELPWISAVEPWISSDAEAAKSALTQASKLAISAFPFTILPNKFVKELRSLAKSADLSIPFVDELAADIFMNAFSGNFLLAAQEAAGLLQGTLYERYYGIDYAQLLALSDIAKDNLSTTPISPGFARICNEMAASETGARSVANNGAVIEQGQIITTHNLASLWLALDLKNSTGSLDLLKLAKSCFQWICRRQQYPTSDWRVELKSIKNCAYAWRQMLFYLSMCTDEEQKEFLSGAEEHLSKQTTEFRDRFAPAMLGLSATISGDKFDELGNHSSGGKRFLGWSTKRHFLRRQINN